MRDTGFGGAQRCASVTAARKGTGGWSLRAWGSCAAGGGGGSGKGGGAGGGDAGKAGSGGAVPMDGGKGGGGKSGKGARDFWATWEACSQEYKHPFGECAARGLIKWTWHESEQSL